MNNMMRPILAALVAVCLVMPACSTAPSGAGYDDDDKAANLVLEWNQILIDTLIATNTSNALSPRLGAMVHTAMFDAYNGVQKEFTPIFYRKPAPEHANARAAAIAAGYYTLVGLFPSRKEQLHASYAAAIKALVNGGEVKKLYGIDYGTAVAQAVLAWRADDGFSAALPEFRGGTAIGQWQPTPPAFGPMSVQAMAFAKPFILDSSARFRPAPPRGLHSKTFVDDFNAVRTLGRRSGSTRTEDQTALAPFWEGNATVHWNQAANQAARANNFGLSQSARMLAVLNLSLADTGITIWSAKRFYGADSAAATWRPVTAIPLAASIGNGLAAEADWQPLINTPPHPEYPAGHPALNGAGATALLLFFKDAQMFTLTAPGLPDRRYSSISRAREDGNNARVWGGMHYPSSVAISDAVGEAIAKHVNANAMQKRR